jgi:hypothetical protein
MRTSALLCALLSVVLGSSGAAADTIPFPGSYPTIQAAIDGAPDGSVIQLAPGHYHELLTLYGITHGLTLRGDPANPASVILDGDGQLDSVLRISDSSSALVIEGVTITGGRGLSGRGGAVFMNESQPVFRDCVFTDNHADQGGAVFILKSGGLFQRCVFHDNTSNNIGGAILMHDGSSTAFEACQFLDNTSGVTEPLATYGGALVVNDSSATFVGCKISGNHSKYAAGGIAVTAPSYDRPTQVVTFRDTEISDNVADRGAPGLPAAEGGGMHIEDNAYAILERCHVHDNVAHRGGGLNVYRARYTITDSLIEDNRADTVDGGAGAGGGIYAASVNTAPPTRDPARVEIIRTAIRGNSAASGGGMYVQGDFGGLTTNHASLVITNSVIAANTASVGGGGIEADETDATITGSIILSNVVGSGGSYGGGILSAAGSNLSVSNTTIAGNATAQQGGGIYVDQGGHVDIADSELFANTANPSIGGGAIAVGQAPGPVAGPISGSVTRTVIAENGPDVQIYEADCDLASWSTVTYTSNTMHGSATPYYRSCNGASASVAAFNGLRGKASGNVSAPATFARFLAAPGTITAGSASVLAWSVPGASSLTVDGGVGTVGGPSQTRDVAPGATTTYALAQGMTPRGTATVTVACAALGIPFPRTPAHGGLSGLASSAVLAWYAAAGATTYDLYVDTTDDPTTLVAQDLTDTTFTLDGLTEATNYNWKVVATSPQCGSTSASPVFSFHPGSTATACTFHDEFDDGLASDWARTGKGVMGVVDGALRLVGAPMLMAAPPAAAFGDGSFSVSLNFAGRKRSEARLVFAVRDKRNYREAVVQGNGAVRLYERAGPRRKVVARARRKLTPGTAAVLRLDVAGNTTSLSINGNQALNGTFSAAAQGTVGIKALRSTFTIDDVCIDAGS